MASCGGLEREHFVAGAVKLAMEDWISDEVEVRGLPVVKMHQLYRAMDFLLESAAEVQRNVFSAVANLFNLEVDVIFFDTTTTYFEGAGLSEGEEEELLLKTSPTPSFFGALEDEGLFWVFSEISSRTVPGGRGRPACTGVQHVLSR